MISIAPPLAMHMANELLSVPVAAVTLLVMAVAVAIAARQARRAANDDRLPLMGVVGAFVFAAQMINFNLPGMPGTSGHLGGGVLLAILLGPATAIVTMAAILIVQCLLFQDGGLLALGCNIINMGVVPCLLGWGLYRILLGPAARAAAWRQYLAAWVACVGGVTAGAAMVPVEAAASGVLQVPLSQFLGVMIGVHLVIALGEGAVTFAVIAYLRRVRSELMGVEPIAMSGEALRPGYGVVIASLLGTALLLAGVVSWFASTCPDGLEWSYLEHRYEATGKAVRNESPVIAAVDRWQSKWSPMTDYTRRETPLGQAPAEETAEREPAWPRPDGWRSLAGLLGTIVTLSILYGASRWMRKHTHGCSAEGDSPSHRPDTKVGQAFQPDRTGTSGWKA
ncbi:MAG: energy-coupling factor ABC transporter permease [Thermoguttaceae bacterium]